MTPQPVAPLTPLPSPSPAIAPTVVASDEDFAQLLAGCFETDCQPPKEAASEDRQLDDDLSTLWAVAQLPPISVKLPPVPVGKTGAASTLDAAPQPLNAPDPALRTAASATPQDAPARLIELSPATDAALFALDTARPVAAPAPTSASAATPTPITPFAMEGAWVEAMASRIVATAREGGGEALALRLSPRHLGDVELHLDALDSAAPTLRIVAVAAAAEALLRDHRHELQQAVDRNGMALASVEVTPGQTGARDGWSPTGERHRPPPPPPRRPGSAEPRLSATEVAPERSRSGRYA